MLQLAPGKIMKTLLLVFACAFGEDADPTTVRAIEGAKILHSSMRDPDSFKIGRVWIIQSAKYGEAAWICYEYYARNGFGGMNFNRAVYSPHSKKDLAQGKYILDVGDSDHEPYRLEGCKNQPDGKHTILRGDVTKEVKQALKDEVDNAKP